MGIKVNHDFLSLVKDITESKNDKKVLDIIIDLIHMDDISHYKDVVDLLVQYVYDLIHDSYYERLIYFSEPIKKLLKKPSSPLPIDEYYEFASMISYVLDDYEEAVSIFEEYFACKTIQKNSLFYYNSMLNYAYSNFCLNHVEKAKAVIDELLRVFDENTDPRFIFIMNMTRAEIMMKENELDGVYELIQDSLNSPLIDRIIKNKIDCYLIQSKYYEKTHKMDLALKWYEKAVQIVEENGLEFEEKTTYHDYAEFLLRYGDFEKSAYMYKKFVELTKDALSKNRKLIRIRSELETYIKQKEDESKQLKLENERIKQESNRDYLTGIYNKRYVNKVMKEYFSYEPRVTLSLFIFDIDNFKKINDTYGHQAGDLVIKKMSETLSHHLDESHIFARTGGDEFMICFFDTDINEVKTCVTLVMGKISSLLIYDDEEEIKISISGGIASTSEAGVCDMKSLIKKADERLYLSKSNGKATFFLEG